MQPVKPNKNQILELNFSILNILDFFFKKYITLDGANTTKKLFLAK